jgi:hypothetical protein
MIIQMFFIVGAPDSDEGQSTTSTLKGLGIHLDAKFCASQHLHSRPTPLKVGPSTATPEIKGLFPRKLNLFKRKMTPQHQKMPLQSP